VRLASAAGRWVLAVAVLGEAMVLLLLVFHTYVSVITTCQYVGGWLTGQWITGGIDPDAVHPGYFLPTAAGGLIGASAAAAVHLHALAEASFGIGVICWLLLASMILNRLITRPALPNALVPTMAIELGIPAVAGPAYFAVAGRTVTFMACALGGYAVLMALVQVRLIPVYRRLSFTPDSGPSASPTPRPSVTRWCGSRSRSRPPRPATRSRSSRCSPPLSRGSPSARCSSPSAGSSY
jgi:tellurite resistance protein TehA-like permease